MAAALSRTLSDADSRMTLGIRQRQVHAVPPDKEFTGEWAWKAPLVPAR